MSEIPKLTPEQEKVLTEREDAAMDRPIIPPLSVREVEDGIFGPPPDLTMRAAVGRIEACLYETFGRQHRSENGSLPSSTNVVDALIMVATSLGRIALALELEKRR